MSWPYLLLCQPLGKAEPQGGVGRNLLQFSGWDIDCTLLIRGSSHEGARITPHGAEQLPISMPCLRAVAYTMCHPGQGGDDS